jgi:2-C-methyl-D-erythritol 4-phosphate cytidylyltransferase
LNAESSFSSPVPLGLQLPAGIGCHVVVVGGGSGLRFGGQLPKQFLPLGGQPVLAHTLRRFLGLYSDLTVTLVLPQAYIEDWQVEQRQYFSAPECARILVVAGGSTRTQSVLLGLAALCGQLSETHPTRTLVAVQDAVRPLTTPQTIVSAYLSAAQYGTGVAAVPSKSSLRRKTATGSQAVDRAEYFAVQTPQVFRLDWLWDAYHRITDKPFTDDASLVEDAGYPIHLVAGGYDNLKITTPEDLALAEVLLPAFTAQWG